MHSVLRPGRKGRRREAAIGSAGARVSGNFPLSAISRLETRLARQSWRITSSSEAYTIFDTTDSTTATAEASQESTAAGEHMQINSSTKNATNADETSDGREVASVLMCSVGSQDAPAARALCEVLREFERLMGTAEGGEELLSQLSDILRLCVIISKDVLDRCEHSSSPSSSGHHHEEQDLAELGDLVERARKVATLCQKGRIARFARNSRKASRNLDSLKEKLLFFATNHEPELAVTQEVYVSCLTLVVLLHIA